MILNCLATIKAQFLFVPNNATKKSMKSSKLIKLNKAMQPDKALQPDKAAVVGNGFPKDKDIMTLTILWLPCQPLLTQSNQLQVTLLKKNIAVSMWPDMIAIACKLIATGMVIHCIK